MRPIKFRHAFTALFSLSVICLAVFGIRAMSESPKPRILSRPSPLAESEASLGDKQIARAELLVSRSPSNPDAYNLLCAGFLQKARETGDFNLNAKAEAALTRSLALDAGNYDAIKLKATLLLTYHRFGEALEVARLAQLSRPKDHLIYGALTDALVELGRYDEADEAVETMMSLKPDASSYARMSYLMWLHGEPDAAIKVMRAAVKASTRQDAEGLAWCLVHLGDELLKSGKVAEAEREIDLALSVFPKYHLALAAKARARMSAGDMSGAVELYRRAQDRVPLPDTAIALGDLYLKLGEVDEAKKQYELVEFIEQSNSAAGLYSRQLALFWANHNMKLDEALSIAQRERVARSDIFTCDTLAWCLFKKGNLLDARRAIDEAMRLGTRDAQIYYHAGMISNALGDRASAVKHLKVALKINPSFDILQADIARSTLGSH